MISAVKGIARWGILQPQPTGVPVVVVWNFTNQCNLKCLHCHQDSTHTPGLPELNTSEAFKVVENMANAGVSVLTFSGGEPLTRQDLYDVVKYADANGMHCTLATNGTLIDDEVAERLKLVHHGFHDVGGEATSGTTRPVFTRIKFKRR